MNYVTKLISAGTIASSLLLGTMVVDTNEVSAKTSAVQKPYYYYNGYTYYNGSFILDKYFVKALKYDNVKINGHKINPKAAVGVTGILTKKYDTEFLTDEKGRLGNIKMMFKPGTVKKSAFMKAHQANHIEDMHENMTGGGYILYKTNKAHYLVSFNENNYVTSMEIGVIGQ